MASDIPIPPTPATGVKARAEIDSLTGIRALAAWWVVAFHAAGLLTYAFHAPARVYWLARLGYLGVDLFFVLSGFIIAYNYWDRFKAFSSGSYLRFLWLRLARIYPVHLFTLLVSALFLAGVKLTGMAIVKSFATWTPGNFLANVLMVHAWLPNFVESWNNASWSISCEWFVYLIFPVLVLSRMHRLPNWIAGALTVLLPAIFIGLVQTGYTGLFTPLIQVVCEFAAGCLLYRIYIRQSAGKFTANLLMPAALGSTLTVLALLWRQPQMAGHWLVLTFPLLILAIARSNRLAGRALASRPALYWGRVSYSLYMTHSVTLWPLKAFFPLRESAGFAHRIGLACIWIGSIAVVAALTYHFVEEPARHWMRGKSPFAKRVAANRAAPERTQ